MEIFGILNLTTDSFSDGGLYLGKDGLIKAEGLLQDGAKIIDLGAQSSNPDAELISEETEWNRLDLLIPYLKSKKAKISIDTFRPQVIQKSIESGVDYINNINSFQDENSLEILAANKTKLPELILMHSSSDGIAFKESQLSPQTVIDKILYFFDNIINHLVKAGIEENKLIFDPGMGFFLGADPMLSITVLKNIELLKNKLGRLMISVSRKSFIGNLLGGVPPEERGAGTLACELYLYLNSEIDYIRTHDVKQLKQAIEMIDLIKGTSKN